MTSSTLGMPLSLHPPSHSDRVILRHALQLRQAKLAFPYVPPDQLAPSSSAVVRSDTDERDWVPGVYMIAGVNTDEDCMEHKSRTVMTHAER